MTTFRDPRRLLILAAVAILVGATLFGLWHVVVGGLIHGNARAAGFGVVLATLAGGLAAAIAKRGPFTAR